MNVAIIKMGTKKLQMQILKLKKGTTNYFCGHFRQNFAFGKMSPGGAEVKKKLFLRKEMFTFPVGDSSSLLSENE